MFLYPFRIGVIIARAALRPKVKLDVPYTFHGRAWPWLCDFNLHVNHAHYLTLMEHARWAWSTQTGLVQRLRRHRWRFIVIGSEVLYRRELKLGRTLRCITNIESFDNHSIVIRQEIFCHNNKQAALGLVRAQVRGPSSAIPPQEIIAELAVDSLPPSPSTLAQTFLTSQQTLLSELSSPQDRKDRAH
ncbi:MAG: acyl-CoA thioesterase [Myxococcales bacterium]|nr:acyl-CoA thioesterase [Myxococcales bacterium]